MTEEKNNVNKFDNYSATNSAVAAGVAAGVVVAGFAAADSAAGVAGADSAVAAFGVLVGAFGVVAGSVAFVSAAFDNTPKWSWRFTGVSAAFAAASLFMTANHQADQNDDLVAKIENNIHIAIEDLPADTQECLTSGACTLEDLEKVTVVALHEFAITANNVREENRTRAREFCQDDLSAANSAGFDCNALVAPKP